MKGKRLIKSIDEKMLGEVAADYRNLVLKKRVKENLTTGGRIAGEIILIAGVLAGAMFLTAAAPNVIGAIGKVFGKKKRKPLYFHCDEKEFGKSLTYLKNRHLIELVYEDGKTAVKLTKKGERRYRIRLIENMAIKKQMRWDGWWRIVIFDIPEKFKSARDALRQKFQNLGFFQIQKSVFVIPYPCEKEIDFIRHLFGLENQIRIIQAKYFQGEESARKYFDLD